MKSKKSRKHHKTKKHKEKVKITYIDNFLEGKWIIPAIIFVSLVLLIDTQFDLPVGYF